MTEHATPWFEDPYQNLDLTSGQKLMQKELELREGFVYLDKMRHKKPTVIADFRFAPFRSSMFKTVLFDPPHIFRHSTITSKAKIMQSFLKLYGIYPNRTTLVSQVYAGWREAFRVLKEGGTCIFKWAGNHEGEGLPTMKALGLRPEGMTIVRQSDRPTKTALGGKCTFTWLVKETRNHTNTRDKP